ncbi:MAG: TonB C-terminal domain-containing protein [Kofleriaceae bacterium]
MRLALVLLLVACGHPAAGLESGPRAPRLQPPAVIDPARPDATYLTSIALQLQPGWGQFLDDCRLRLPADHALNRMTLAATAELTLDRTGTLVAVSLVTPSGNADFDRAVKDAIAELRGFGAPPRDALSDDDHVYLRWLFARDRRQAGPVTAAIEHRELPIDQAVARFIAAHDLSRAARRIASAKPPAAITDVMTAALREGLASVDGSVQRAAVEAVVASHATSLAPDVRMLLETADRDLRLAAIAAAGQLDDRAAIATLSAQLARDLAEERAFALAEAAALAKLGRADTVAVAVGKVLPNPIALEVFSRAPAAAQLGQVVAAVEHGSAETRVAACAGLAGVAVPAAIAAVGKGLRDADASVRAACVAAVTETAASAPKLPKLVAALASRVVALQHDRDRAVRANAVIATSLVDPAHLDRAIDDPAAEVRGAYAHALGYAGAWEPGLRTLVEDRDAEVRAAAWSAYAVRGVPAGLRSGIGDPSPDVRRAAITTTRDNDALRRLVTSDDAPDVRTAALAELAHRLGRDAIAATLLEAFAATRPASADRVRIARAWLLAP